MQRKKDNKPKQGLLRKERLVREKEVIMISNNDYKPLQMSFREEKTSAGEKEVIDHELLFNLE